MIRRAFVSVPIECNETTVKSVFTDFPFHFSRSPIIYSPVQGPSLRSRNVSNVFMCNLISHEYAFKVSGRGKKEKDRDKERENGNSRIFLQQIMDDERWMLAQKTIKLCERMRWLGWKG